MDRRRFLSLSAFYTVAAASGTLVACHHSSDDEGSGNGGTPPPPPTGAYAFPQGVASGDPRDTSVVFWTRCVAKAGGAGQPVPLTLQVSPLADFSQLAASVALSAVADYDYTVRAKVTGLTERMTYYYRFVAGGDISAMGATRTAPAANQSIERLRFAWFTCQNWSANHWQAMTLMAAETDLDFVVHLGDYIYETVGSPRDAAEPAHPLITLPDGVPHADGGFYANSLADYRTLYRTYRGDARLQTVHARFPMIAIWDDHEFSDDCWQDHQTYTNANERQTARRRNANQAWAEYLPVDWGDVSFDLNNASYDNIRIYRDFRFGALLHLMMTDERLYRDDHVVSEAAIAQGLGHDAVNGNDIVGSRYFVPQQVLAQFEALDTQRLGRAPSILGPTQTQWWKDTLKASTATWKVWGNEVMMNRMWLDLRSIAPAPANTVFVLDCDAWDGYPSHKAELMSFVKTQGIANLVAITGDLHAFQAGIVRDNPDPATGTPVMVDLMAAGISSRPFFRDVATYSAGMPLASLISSSGVLDTFIQQNNPDMLYADHDGLGYASATVTAGQFIAIFNKVKSLNADGTAPQDALAKRTRLTINAGAVSIGVEDNV
ncbi:alkaline phosphatase D family protein [Caballeronia sp. LZ025]|uniref:alkaline phosphatase D family protein n=1 Tax=Caballeronia TaxID=1827195 RepID=UPI001FD26214|nr:MULTISPECIES: alkaline phosphatase D family protein [Caballeronia]MDR5735084.1 alkaline phosphatase D family protein [Caballeronia sp. LZ025]